jgi:hypothetical protein
MVTICVDVSTGVTTRFKVAIESQPVTVIKLSMKLPEVLYTFPFQVKGRLLAQTVTFSVVVITGFTVKIRVAMESQPAEVKNEST